MLVDDNSNVKRKMLNDLMWVRFSRRRPVFRLDHLESLIPNGKVPGFRMDGDNYLSLANMYTNDRGHFNRQGGE